MGPIQHLAELERNLTRLTYSCREKRKLGGWHVCFDQRHRSSWRPPCTAFSFGLGGDWSFEEAKFHSAPCTPVHARKHLYRQARAYVNAQPIQPPQPRCTRPPEPGCAAIALP